MSRSAVVKKQLLRARERKSSPAPGDDLALFWSQTRGSSDKGLRERRRSKPETDELPEDQTMTDAAPSPEPASAPDPLAAIKSRSYIALLVLGALVGVPVATVAYFVLDGVAKLQSEIFTDLPKQLGFHGEPLWWPLP